ncbi:sugar phosphate isomerase/epimerase [Rhodococcus sp. SORGH_AS_0301]|uniref:sugar phosphate isomerase/epimerase family protein n=1 Tax=Rhodococcus sp. SORGH_AS_0301 TaxID=3041780 RepID=UPI002784F295|nr:sugar phosphate isomerase/epimerase [Rhodococcus sp. SORGH_AS_0301]MDQ1181808.1 sugar phosphate isomerase/epimerase [Rhodococcus sp. SORGH_AS_0301]
MKIGLITDSLSHLSFTDTLDAAARAGVSSVEIATGNWSTSPHADLGSLVSSDTARADLVNTVTERGLTISALNANGNQLHPVTGPQHDQVVRDTIMVAGELGVPTVVLMSGLPGGSRDDTTSNWVTTSWPPENIAVLDYQWNDVALPYWTSLAAHAKRHGVRLAVEACGAQLVHNTTTLRRLSDATDPSVVGANLDPSHLMWMGADIPSVIAELNAKIFHVHAKDVRINHRIAGADGLLDVVPITRPQDRAWNYVTLGLGHPGGATFWADFVYNLKAVGYDGTLNIEHEDALVNASEGVGKAAHLLRQVILEHAPDWKPAQI